MKAFKLTLAIGLVGLSVVGCSRDTLVHGPYLIGAERPGPGGPDCRPASIRSQDSKSDWDSCMREPVAAAALEQSESDWRPVVSDREEDLPNEATSPASPPRATRSTSRSAWQ